MTRYTWVVAMADVEPDGPGGTIALVMEEGQPPRRVPFTTVSPDLQEATVKWAATGEVEWLTADSRTTQWPDGTVRVVARARHEEPIRHKRKWWRRK